MQSATAADKIVTEEVRLEPEVNVPLRFCVQAMRVLGRRRSWCLARVWAWRTHSTQPFRELRRRRVSLHQAWLDMPVPGHRVAGRRACRHAARARTLLRAWPR